MVKHAHEPPKPGGQYKKSGKTAVPKGTVKGAGRKRKVAVVVEYDAEARREYLTGFSKRKKERQEKAVSEAEEKLKEERLARRSEIRDRVNALRQLTGIALDDKATDAEKGNVVELQDSTSDGGEIEVDRQEYEEEAEVTTVVTTAFNMDPNEDLKVEGDLTGLKSSAESTAGKELNWDAENDSDEDAVEDIAQISAKRQKIQEARYALKEFKRAPAPQLKVKVKGANRAGKKNPNFTPKTKGKGKTTAEEPKKKKSFGRARGTKGKRG
eukprot:CFRG3840T1